MNSYLNTYTNKNRISNISKYKTSRNILTLNDNFNHTINMLSYFGNSRFLSDTSLNKYYKKYVQKQAHIQHQQKLYEIIEKLDDTKVFNALKNEYLKEKALLQNIQNTKKDNKRIIYASHFVNIKNWEEKLNSVYKLSAQDYEFMNSLMRFLGNRQKKIYKPKINKKLEALSQGKIGLLLKKKELSKQESKKEELSKQESNTNSLYNYNSQKNGTLITKNPYLKMLLKDPNDNNANKNPHINSKNNNNNILSKTKEEFYNSFNSVINNSIRRKSIGYTNNMGNTQRFLGKTKSTKYGLTGYNFFVNNTNPNEAKYTYYNNNNIKNDNLITNTESPNDISNTEDKNTVNSNIFKNYNKANSKFNSQTSLFSLKNKSRNRSKNSTAKKKTKENTNIINSLNQNTLENKIIPNQTIKNNDELDLNKIHIENEDNTEDLSVLSNIKKQDKRTLKNKLIKKYKNTMNEFLQKIKDEEKDLYNNSSKLSSLLYKFKKYESFEKIKNKSKKKINNSNKNYQNLTYNLQSKRSSTTLNLKRNNLNKLDNKNNMNMAKTFYPSLGKSKYSIPYINRIVYGEENSLDPFEQLQKDLFFEVKNEIRKSNFINKKKGKNLISINGKEILNKFKNNEKEDSDE